MVVVGFILFVRGLLSDMRQKKLSRPKWGWDGSLVFVLVSQPNLRRGLGVIPFLIPCLSHQQETYYVLMNSSFKFHPTRAILEGHGFLV